MERLFTGSYARRLRRSCARPRALAGLVVGLALPVLALGFVVLAGLAIHQLLGLFVSHAGWLQTLALAGVLAMLLGSPLLVLGLAAGANRREGAWAQARVRSVDQRVSEAIHLVEHDLEDF